MWRRSRTIALSALIVFAANRSIRGNGMFLFLHEVEGDSPLGWRAFVLFMVGVLITVLLFDEMAHRAIKAIRRHRRSSFVSRLLRRSPTVFVKLRKLLARSRR